MSTDYFEVQELKLEGDRTGHWDAMTGSLTEDAARARRLEYREAAPRPYRVVPFAFGPNPRPGDVLPDRSIYIGLSATLGESYVTKGRVQVTAEQAENAALMGWEPTGEVRDGGKVVIDSAAQ